ncbi:AAA family ATPase (plasmid) [Verrucomicrobiaceae bacterium 227]
MIVATANSKGGVGKSTIATHFAIWLKENQVDVCLVDSDVQSSSTIWAHEADPSLPIERLQTPDEILDRIPELEEKYEAIVIDGPAGLSEVTRAIMLKAHLALLPCGPSVLDLRAADDAVKVLKQARSILGGDRPEAVLIPNKIQKNLRLSQELLLTAEDLGIHVSKGLGLRTAYADAAGQGTVVWRMGSSAKKAADEIITLFEDVIEHAKKTIYGQRS